MASIQSFIHRKVVILNQNTSAQDAARAMRDHQIGCAIVTDDKGKLAGIVTDRDFACRLTADYSTTQVALSKVMTHDLVVANEDSKLSDVVQLMETHGIRRIPIVHDNKCVGIVTLDDLIVSNSIEPTLLRRIVQRQIGRRVRKTGTRSEQTLDHFYKHIGDKTDLTPDVVPGITHFLLGSMLRRLSYTAAMHLIAQLPLRIQDSLIKLPPGPDRSITAVKLVEETATRHSFAEDYARSIVENFFSALAEFLGPDSLKNIKAQLPEDLRTLFSSELPEAPTPRKERVPVKMKITSPAFKEDSDIPKQYTGEGEDRNPAIEWSDVPKGTKEFALLCEDPDATTQKPWVHWVVYGISPKTTLIPEGLPKSAKLDIPVRITQGKTSSGGIGYQGPLPPRGHGSHRYYFKVYALDRETALPPGATKEQLVHEMLGHVLGEAVLMGRYQRGPAVPKLKVA